MKELGGLDRFRIKKAFPEIIIYKIYETNSNFRVKEQTTGKV